MDVFVLLTAADDASVESAVTADTGKKFTGGKKPLTLERVKVSPLLERVDTYLSMST